VATYGKLWRRFGNNSDVQIRDQMARALINKGIEKTPSRTHAETLASADEVVRRYRDDPAPELRRLAAKALFHKRTLLCRAEAEDPESATRWQLTGERPGELPGRL
jgi:hypothetical protein